MRPFRLHAASMFACPAVRMHTIRFDLFDDMIAMLREYRAECEGLDMPETVAEIDRLLAKVEA